MKKEYCGIFVIIITSLFIAACAVNEADINEDTVQTQTEIYTDEEVSSKEETVDTEDGKENDAANDEAHDDKTPEILHFVDVFKQEYEVEINPNIEPKAYKDEYFTREGEILKYDDGRYYSRLGIDVSRHQGSIDWHKVKEFGVEFAFIRIGYRGYGTVGNIKPDERFDENIANAQEEGIDVGVYFFSQAISDEEAQEEAEFVIKALEGYELQLPVVYDPESILDAVARTDDVTPEQFTRNAGIFCETISSAGYKPMIYSNMLWEAYNFDLEKLAKYPVWYADYEPYPQTPYTFEFWQYTNEGNVPGISGEVDLNIQMLLL